jgi:two-component system sensor histidine kinase MprB
MTLRARFALSLGLLAALSVMVVALTSYFITAHRLHDDLDNEVVSYASRFTDPGGRTARMLCDQLSTPSEFAGANPLQGLGGILAGLPQGAIECVDASGTVTGWTGLTRLPVDTTGLHAGATSAVPTTSTALPGPGGLGAGPSGSGGPPSGGHGPPVKVPRPRTEAVGGSSYRVVTVSLPGGGEVQIARSLADTNNALSSIRTLALLAGVGVIALAAAAGWLIAGRTVRPVQRLTTTAEAVAATGDLEMDLPSGGRDEVGRLTRAFRSMLDALRGSRAQQQRLVQDAGHELRTPLTSLRANIDTLRRHPELSGEPRQHLLDDLHSELGELSSLMNELVALAADRYDNEPEQVVSLPDVARQAARRTERRSGHPVTVDAEPATADARPGQLLRAVSNLLDNAAKFSAPGSPITVTVRPGYLAVRDHGPGIAAEDLPFVFDRFYRAVGVRSQPGSGLGLSIVREAAQAAGGDVRAENAPDGGAVLTMTLPPAD